MALCTRDKEEIEILKDRNLSAREVSVYGLLLVLGGAALGVLVTMEIVSGNGSSEVLDYVLMGLALAGCFWAIGKGHLLLCSKYQAAQIMSVRALYAMSVLMVVVALILSAIAQGEGAWLDSLPVIGLFLAFAALSAFRASKRQRFLGYTL